MLCVLATGAHVTVLAGAQILPPRDGARLQGVARGLRGAAPVLLTTLSNTLYRQVCGYTGGPLLLRATTLASIADSAVPRSLALLDLAIQVTPLQCEDDLDADYLQHCRVWTPA